MNRVHSLCVVPLIARIHLGTWDRFTECVVWDLRTFNLLQQAMSLDSMQVSFPLYQDLWESGAVAPLSPHITDAHAIHTQRTKLWNDNLRNVVYPVIQQVRHTETGTFNEITLKDFSANSSTTWNPFPGPETCFKERHSLAVKCNFMLGYK
jgi:hypothetical protein